MVVLLEGSPISTKEIWSAVRVTIGFLVTSLSKALLPQLLSLARQPALGRVFVVPNFFHLRMTEAIVQKSFGTLPQICANTIASRSSTDNSFYLIKSNGISHMHRIQQV